MIAAPPHPDRMTSPPAPPSARVFVAGCLLAAGCADLSRYHERHNADTLIPVLVSLYKWEPFYWGQDRLGMVLPAIAAPFPHPLANLLVQSGLAIFGGLASVGLVARYLLRDDSWAAVGAAAAALFLVACPAHDRFHVLNGAQPYQVPLALALGGVLSAAGGRPVAGVVLTGVAYWYNSGLAVVTGPLAVGRFLVAWGEGPPAPPGARLVGRSRADPAVHELVVALGLTVLGTVFGRWLMGFSSAAATDFALTPPGEWAAGWGRMAAGIRLRFAGYLGVVGVVAAGGVGWLFVPATRAAAVRYWAAAGVAVGGLAALVLVSGVLVWVKMNEFDVRYVFPGLVGLAPAAVGVLVGPALAGFPRAARWAGLLAAVAVPAAAVAVFGPPSVTAARAAVDRAAGGWTADALDTDCTHLVGDYCAVWPAAFHVNMTLADRGDPRVVWGVSFRAEATRDVWSAVPRAATRLGWLKWPRDADLADAPAASVADWRAAYPATRPVAFRPTLDVRVPLADPAVFTARATAPVPGP